MNIDNIKQHKQKFDGEIHKCPNCGEIVDYFDYKCKSCGYEFRNTESSKLIKDLTLALLEVDKNIATKKHSIFRSGFHEVDENTSRKIGIISNFPMPNTKEDIFEFMILAASNIDSDILGKGDTVYSQDDVNRKALSEIWLSKMEQINDKSKMILDKEDYLKIESILCKKKDDIVKGKEKYKKGMHKTWQTIGIFWGILILFLSIVPFSVNILEKNQEKKLNEIYKEIQILMEKEQYEEALFKTYELEYGNTSNKAKAWEERKENLIKKIKEKMK